MLYSIKNLTICNFYITTFNNYNTYALALINWWMFYLKIISIFKYSYHSKIIIIFILIYFNLIIPIKYFNSIKINATFLINKNLVLIFHLIWVWNHLKSKITILLNHTKYSYLSINFTNKCSYFYFIKSIIFWNRYLAIL